MTRRSRLVTAIVAAAALLFGQLALAAYACPKLAEAPVAETICDHDMAETPNLCVQHCLSGEKASVGSVQPSPSVPDLTAIAVPFSPATIPDLPAAGDLRPAASPAHPPPLIVRFTVLRI